MPTLTEVLAAGLVVIIIAVILALLFVWLV